MEDDTHHKHSGDLWVDGIYQVSHYNSNSQFPQLGSLFNLHRFRGLKSPYLALSAVNISGRRPG